MRSLSGAFIVLLSSCDGTTVVHELEDMRSGELGVRDGQADVRDAREADAERDVDVDTISKRDAGPMQDATPSVEPLHWSHMGALGGAQGTCGIRRESGELMCWGEDAHGGFVSPLPGRYSQVSGSPWGGCALDEQGHAECWNSRHDATPPFWEPPVGSYRMISTGYAFAYVGGREQTAFYACALSFEGELTCWGALEDPQQGRFAPVEAPAGRFSLVSVGTNFACAITLEGELVCWGPRLEGIPRSDVYRSVTVGHSSLCAVSVSNEIRCSPGLWDFAAVAPGPVRQLAITEGVVYALLEDGSLHGWIATDPTGLQPIHLNEPIYSLTHGQAHACAIRVADDSGICWGYPGEAMLPARN